MGMGFGNSPMEPDPILHHVHPRNYSFVQQHPSGELGGFEIEYNDEGRVYRGSDGGGDRPVTDDRRAALPSWATRSPKAGRCRLPCRSPASSKRRLGARARSATTASVHIARRSTWCSDATAVRTWKPTHVFVLVFGNDVREDVTYMAHRGERTRTAGRPPSRGHPTAGCSRNCVSSTPRASRGWSGCD